MAKLQPFRGFDQLMSLLPNSYMGHGVLTKGYSGGSVVAVHRTSTGASTLTVNYASGSSEVVSNNKVLCDIITDGAGYIYIDTNEESMRRVA